ncbi:MAG: hypothetical protein H6739_14660 [Alphaproteobacteria bacterium]|nr:hypothetical protein [Alphaproteobacteria bacterium]
MEALRSVPELQTILLEEQDAKQRALAHLELSWIALREGRRDSAVRHLREAVALDRTLNQARLRLRELGESPRAQAIVAATRSAREGRGPVRRALRRVFQRD